MPTLNWIGKDKIVNHDKEVPFRLLKKNKKLSLGESSENLIVEGDNLEALKALMPFYYGKVKCIYIDPPYNTGNEGWVYNDKVNSPKIKEWLGKVVGAEGEDLSRHDKWLCMMYPRLKLLRDLLTEDGVIFVSLDDNEIHHLRVIMDEIFGENNFIANIIWQKRTSPDIRAKIGAAHDYILVFSKKIELAKESINNIPISDKRVNEYKNLDNDWRGPWASVDMTGQTGHATAEQFFTIIAPGGVGFNPPKGRCWAFAERTVKELIKDNKIWFGKNGTSRPRLKRFLSESEGQPVWTWWSNQEVGHNQESTKELNQLFGRADVFNNPKPARLIKRIIQMSTNSNDIIFDSFAGSGTTAHAVLDLNKEDGGNRKFILVELEKDIAQKITSERVRRVAKKIGGDFEYAQLGEPLFDADGKIDKEVSFNALASYIYFTETNKNLENTGENYLGESKGTHYFLFFDEIGKNTFDKKSLKLITSKSGQKVVYADKCLLDDTILEKNQITFKQIPYQIKTY